MIYVERSLCDFCFLTKVLLGERSRIGNGYCLGGNPLAKTRNVLYLLLIGSLLGSVPANSWIHATSFATESQRQKFRPAFSYDYLTDLAITSPNKRVPSILWIARNMSSSVSLDELKQIVAENLTTLHNATINYIGKAFPTVHFSATAAETLKISACEFVQYVDVAGEFIQCVPCQNVSVPAIRADVIANLPYNGSGIKVALIDSGINKTHPDLVGKVILEKDFTGQNMTLDSTGHGTAMAGIIAGGNASSVYKGVAPGVWILSARVTDSSGYTDPSWTAEAIDWAVENGANVISISVVCVEWHWDSYNHQWDYQMRTHGESEPGPSANEAVKHGVVVVAAAGNAQPDWWGLPYNTNGYVEIPADVTGVIAVGATDDNRTVSLQDDDMWSLSAQGPTGDGTVKPDVVAPGVNITSANAGFESGGYYAGGTGTSESAPHVTGVVALLLQAHPGWTPAMVKSAIMSTAVLNDNLQSLSENWRGKGIVDAKRALNCAIDVPTSNPDFNQTGGYGWHSEQVFENGTINTLATSATFWPSLSTARLTKLFNLASTVTRPTFTYGFHEICYYLVFSGWCQVNATLKLSNSTGHVLFSYEQQVEQLQFGTGTVDRFYQISCTYDGSIGVLGSPYNVEFGFSTWASADIIGPSTASVTVHSLSVSIMGVQGIANPSFEERLNSVFVPANWLGNTSGWRELRGDIDGNGNVNSIDLNTLLTAFGSKKGDSKYDWRTDLNGDGKVNGLDLNILLCDYGKQSTRLGGFYSWHVSSPGNFSMYQWMCDYDVVSMRGKHVHFEFWLYTTGQCNTSITVFYAYNGTTNTITSSNYQAFGDWRLYYIDLVLPQNTTAVKLTIRDNTPNLVACIDQVFETIA